MKLISRLRHQLLTADPPDLAEGAVWWRSDLGTLRGYDGFTAVDLNSAAVPRPEDFALLAYNYPPDQMSAASSPLPTAGTIYGCRLWLPRSTLITNIEMGVTTGGSGLTASQCLAALYNPAGSLLSATATQATAWATGGGKTMPLTTPGTLQAGYYDVCFFFNGTTGPAFWRTVALGNVLAANGKLTGQALKYFTADTSRTTTFPATLGTKTGDHRTYWVGLS